MGYEIDQLGAFASLQIFLAARAKACVSATVIGRVNTTSVYVNDAPKASRCQFLGTPQSRSGCAWHNKLDITNRIGYMLARNGFGGR